MIANSSASESLTSTGTIGISCRPAICEARQRRSPAMISKRSCAPRTGRTTIGWITPCCLIESASSLSSASANSFRGLRGFGLRNSIGTLRCARGRSRCAASPPTSPIRLARPRPSRERASSAIASSLGFNSTAPVSCSVSATSVNSMRAQLAFALDDFRCELEISVAADAFEIINQHRLAVGRRLGDAYVARDHGVVDLVTHELPDVGDDLVGQVVARVEHREHDAVDREIWIERRANLFHRLQKLREAFERKELAL